MSTRLLKKLTMPVVLLCGLLLAGCNVNPVGPQDVNQDEMKPTPVIVDPNPKNNVNNAQQSNNLDFDNWIQAGEVYLKYTEDWQTVNDFGWVPFVTRDGGMPNPYIQWHGAAFFVDGEWGYVDGFGRTGCIEEGLQAPSWLTEDREYFLTGCRQRNTSILQNPRVIPGMDDR